MPEYSGPQYEEKWMQNNMYDKKENDGIKLWIKIYKIETKKKKTDKKTKTSDKMEEDK